MLDVAFDSQSNFVMFDGFVHTFSCRVKLERYKLYFISDECCIGNHCCDQLIE